ncbi:peptide chain release factor N(5)-glutamine methyltransferase [Thermodesulfobacteriota bacterium]
MTIKSQWTILELLNWTTAYFKSHNIEDPRASAEILLSHALQLRRIDLYLQYDQPLGVNELASFKSLIRRRTRREPAAYIVGTKEFWSLDLFVTGDALIPRPETECLVERALVWLPENADTSAKTILELGTGSGAISISLANHRPLHFFFASDVSAEAVRLAKKNARAHQLDKRIRFFCGDWFTPVNRRGSYFDMIISNPPYIATRAIKSLEPEIRKYEPELALNGGPDGLKALRHIISRAYIYLSPQGVLLIEMGYDQKDDIAEIIEACGQYEDVVFFKDYSGHDRVVQMCKRRDA